MRDREESERERNSPEILERVSFVIRLQIFLNDQIHQLIDLEVFYPWSVLVLTILIKGIDFAGKQQLHERGVRE